MNHGNPPWSDDERLRRIGAILYESILQAGDTGLPPDDVAETGPEDELRFAEEVMDGTEARVIRYLSRAGEASPAVLRTVIQLPRTSAYRVLTGLVESGRIVPSGHTRALVYRLSTLPTHGQNVEGN